MVGASFVSHIKKAPSPFPADADVVDLIFRDAITGNPCHFVHWSMGKERSPKYHVMASHDVLIVRVVETNLRVEVAHEDLDILLDLLQSYPPENSVDCKSSLCFAIRQHRLARNIGVEVLKEHKVDERPSKIQWERTAARKK